MLKQTKLLLLIARLVTSKVQENSIFCSCNARRQSCTCSRAESAHSIVVDARKYVRDLVIALERYQFVQVTRSTAILLPDCEKYKNP